MLLTQRGPSYKESLLQARQQCARISSLWALDTCCVQAMQRCALRPAARSLCCHCRRVQLAAGVRTHAAAATAEAMGIQQRPPMSFSQATGSQPVRRQMEEEAETMAPEVVQAWPSMHTVLSQHRSLASYLGSCDHLISQRQV